MGMRTRYRKKDQVPAPSQYSLPATMGCKLTTSNMKAGRAFGFNSKPKKGGYDEDLAQAPGLNHYGAHDDNKTRRKAPVPSQAPGPNHYGAH